MKKLTFAKILVAVFATLVLVAMLLSQINLSILVTTLTSINPLYILIGFIFYLCCYFLRDWRFHILLSKKVSFKDLFSIVCVHNMANHILPARTGELSYIYLSNKLHNISVGEGIASLTVVRVFDLITVCFFFFASCIFIQNLPQIASKIIWVIVGLLVVVLSLFLALVFFSEIFVDSIRKVLDRFNLLRFSLVQYLLRKGDEIAHSFMLVKSKKLISCVFVASTLIWCFQYSMLYILAEGMNISLAFWSMIFAMTFVFFTTIFPIQTIGGFGIVEGGWTLGFILMGISKELSISSGFIFHILLLTYALVLGFIGLVTIHKKSFKFEGRRKV